MTLRILWNCPIMFMRQKVLLDFINLTKLQVKYRQYYSGLLCWEVDKYMILKEQPDAESGKVS